MGGVLLGFALGAMAFTTQGREFGNRLGSVAVMRAKKVLDNAKKPTEQSSGAAGDDSHPG